MQSSHSRVLCSAAPALLSVAIGCKVAFALNAGAAGLPRHTGQTVGATEIVTQVAASVPVQVQRPLDAIAPSVVAVGWSGFAETISTADRFALPTPHNPAVLFQQAMLHGLRGSAGAVHATEWQTGAAAAVGALPGVATEELANLWRQRLAAHRAVAGFALTPNKSGEATVGSATGNAAAAQVTLAEGLALLNNIRRQAPDAMDTGPEARLLRAINFINARSVYIAAVLPTLPMRTPATPNADRAPAAAHTLDGVPMMRLSISWSSRSEPPERCRAVVIGETTVTATDWPEDVTPGPWVLALRPNAYYGSLGSGMGNYFRYAVAIETASRPGNGRGPDSPITSLTTQANDLCAAIARAADRTLFFGPIDGVPTVLLPCRGPQEASAALAAAASLTGVKPDELTKTAWGSVKLTQVGNRSIALRLLPEK